MHEALESRTFLPEELNQNADPEFSQKLQRLADTARIIAPRTRGILISNHDTAYTRALYHDARLATVHVQRNIAASGASRQKVGEILAIYAP